VSEDVTNTVHRPEVIPPGAPLPQRRDPVIDAIAHIMDGLIPIGRWRIGLDSLIGVIPGLGDIIGAAIGMVIVLRAVQAGIPRIAIAHMMTNIAIDTLVGAIPLVGDAFDFIYKSNTKNMRIYEEALERRPGATAGHWWFFIVLFAAIAGVLWLLAAGVMQMLERFRAF
jgi:hypothetical protein